MYTFTCFCRIECLICEKKFTGFMGLRLHISRLHLGLKEGEEEADEDDEEVGDSSGVYILQNTMVAGGGGG